MLDPATTSAVGIPDGGVGLSAVLLVYGPLGVMTLVSLIVAGKLYRDLKELRTSHATELKEMRAAHDAERKQWEDRYTTKAESWMRQYEGLAAAMDRAIDSLTRRRRGDGDGPNPRGGR